jgi:hypothetical protein
MRRVLIASVIVLAASSVGWYVASGTSVPAAASSSVERVQPIPADRAPAQPQDVPPCPEKHGCQGGFYSCTQLGAMCGAGSYSWVDTGNASCDNHGTIVTCPAFKTWHTLQGACGNCPCCSEDPACPCPVGGCTGIAIAGVDCR